MRLLGVLRAFCAPPVYGLAKENASAGVSGGDGCQTEKGASVQRARQRKVIHVGDAVFKAAENKDHDAEKQRQIPSYVVTKFVEAVHGDKNENVAQRAQKKQADEAVPPL